MTVGNWKAAKNVLLEIQADVEKLPFGGFSMDDHHKRRQIESSIPGFRFEVGVSWMLNSSWVVSIEAERRYAFGMMYRSLFKHIVIDQDDIEIPERFRSRIETRRMRATRRNWGREDDQVDDA